LRSRRRAVLGLRGAPRGVTDRAWNWPSRLLVHRVAILACPARSLLLLGVDCMFSRLAGWCCIGRSGSRKQVIAQALEETLQTR
jgi:hypothetical protein